MVQPARLVDHGGGPGYVAAITAHRQAKNASFRNAADDPIRRGGSWPRSPGYFPVDERYRIVVPQIRHPPPKHRPTALDTSDGLRRIARRVASLDFDLDTERLALTAFGFGPTENGSLFVPFADATSDHETYWSGRYLDLKIESDGSVVLDVNLAYHPWCAYSNAYSCPVTPEETRLAVPIFAGERFPP